MPLQAVGGLLAGRDVAVCLPFLGARVVVVVVLVLVGVGVVVGVGELGAEGLGLRARALGRVWSAGGVVGTDVPGDGATLWRVAARVALVVQNADAQAPSLPLLLDL